MFFSASPRKTYPQVAYLTLGRNFVKYSEYLTKLCKEQYQYCIYLQSRQRVLKAGKRGGGVEADDRARQRPLAERCSRGRCRRGRLPRRVGGATDLGEGRTAVEERSRRGRHPVLPLHVLEGERVV